MIESFCIITVYIFFNWQVTKQSFYHENLGQTSFFPNKHLPFFSRFTPTSGASRDDPVVLMHFFGPVAPVRSSWPYMKPVNC